MVSSESENQRSIAGLVSQMPTMRGATSKSSRCAQRAAALANSRPIKPQPIIPNRMYCFDMFLLPDCSEPIMKFTHQWDNEVYWKHEDLFHLQQPQKPHPAMFSAPHALERSSFLPSSAV